MGYVGPEFQLTVGDRRVLEGWMRAPSTPQQMAKRAGVILASADGLSVRAMAQRITTADEARIVAATMRPPKAATHWSARSLARQLKISHMTVHRIWKKHGLQPHRVETFKFSTDPDFDRKMADIVGLYLNPPEKALV